MRNVLFDDALPAFASLIRREWGQQAIEKNLFLRDVTGRLTFVVLVPEPTNVQKLALAQKAEAKLAPYVDSGEHSIATPDELFDSSLTLANARRIRIHQQEFSGEVFLIDRRMVGADWLRTPAHNVDAPVRIAFASLKGGVGRSTALCVVAAHLATRGKRVLTIDMDLEAPGLGNMLLPEKTLPRYGLLDYLVEQSFGELDEEFYVDLIGSSWLGGGRGRVDVIPALGSQSLNNPDNVLAKLARAYLSGPEIDGTVSTFSDHMSALVARVGDRTRYDVILIDARAGLHETTASAFVGLGAEMLLFGIDQPQTYAAYKLLFAHLGTLPVDPKDDWRNHLQFVQSRVTERNGESTQRFASTITALSRQYLWPSLGTQDMSDETIGMLSETFEVEWDEADQELLNAEEETFEDWKPEIVNVFNDPQYAFFDPISEQSALERTQYLRPFGDLLEAVDILLTERTDDGV